MALAPFLRLVAAIAALCTLLTSPALAEAGLHLKSRLIQAGGQAAEMWVQPLKRRSISTSHVLVQFQGPAREAEEALRRRGIRVVEFVPDSGFLVSLPDEARIAGPEVRWTAPLRPSDKFDRPAAMRFSRDLEVRDFVVALHSDVAARDGRAIAVEEKVLLRDHPDLKSNHLLARGTAVQMEALAEWDEVAYIFPASVELSSGAPTVSCPGPAAGPHPVGEYVARMGEGWDGPGRSGADLQYLVTSLGGNSAGATATPVVERAAAEWARHAKLRFLPGTNRLASRTIAILFAKGEHGDSYPFDGPGRVLAHTFYPPPFAPEPIAGDMHFDDDENWASGALDLYSVVLHEIGHALGLGHSNTPGTVMYPYYQRTEGLKADDVTALLDLYAPAGPPSPNPAPALGLTIDTPAGSSFTTSASFVAVLGSSSGGTGSRRITWSTDRGLAGVAEGADAWRISSVPLLTGANALMVTVEDTPAEGLPNRLSRSITLIRQAESIPPALTITAPLPGGYSTTTGSVVVRGSASHPDGISRVSWRLGADGGDCLGTTDWQTPPVALAPGQNVIAIEAFGSTGGTISRTLTIEYLRVENARDTVKPSLIILAPAGANVLTSLPALSLRGTARDNTGVAAVVWSNSAGGSGTAAGSANWSISDLPLTPGINVITVRAKDAAGNEDWRTLTVTKRN